MYFYELALLKSPLENLTFQSEEEIKIGTKVLIKLKQRKALDEAVIVKIVEKPDFKCTDISEITNEFYDEKMLEIASFISTYYVCSLGEALSIYNPFDRNINQVIDAEIFDSKIVLSSLQEKAKEFLKQKKQALLFANTGAGKTEIYIKIIEECLNSGKQAVLLMPEISLTPQMHKRLEKVFAKSVQRGERMSVENTKHAAEPYVFRDVQYKWQAPNISKFSNRTFNGFHRNDGRVGTANYWLFIPTVFCENRNLDVIKEGIIYFSKISKIPIKLNCVLIRGFNDQEMPELISFAREYGLILRFIEFMPLDKDVWDEGGFIPSDEIVDRLRFYDNWVLQEEKSNYFDGPAKYYINHRYNQKIGVISAVSHHFCSSCNRLRVTALGELKPCLFSDEVIPLRDHIRNRNYNEIIKLIHKSINLKPVCWKNLNKSGKHMSQIGG